MKHSLGLNVNEKALVRRVHTSTQTKLTRSERLKNLNNAFVVVNKNAIKGKVVLLVDDVYTTGSTLNECAKTLLKANAAKVYAITVAHNEIETKPFQI